MRIATVLPADRRSAYRSSTLTVAAVAVERAQRLVDAGDAVAGLHLTSGSAAWSALGLLVVALALALTRLGAAALETTANAVAVVSALVAGTTPAGLAVLTLGFGLDAAEERVVAGIGTRALAALVDGYPSRRWSSCARTDSSAAGHSARSTSA